MCYMSRSFWADAEAMVLADYAMMMTVTEKARQ